jgi:DNA-binding NtrC family response regulator
MKIYLIEDRDFVRNDIIKYSESKRFDINYFDFSTNINPNKNSSIVPLINYEIVKYDPDVILLDLAWNDNEEKLIEKVIHNIDTYDIKEVKENLSVFKLMEILELESKFIPIIIFTLYSSQIKILFEKIYKRKTDYIIKQKPSSINSDSLDILLTETLITCEQAKIFLDNANQYFITPSSININLYSELLKVSRSDISIILQGPTGVGKSIVAEIIHRNSSRSAFEFVILNCNEINVETFESQLFGHLKGAFTDAKEDKKGIIAKADHGTLFIDEIGKLPLDLQYKLLRFVETKEYRVMGKVEYDKCDFRLIVAANENLSELAQEDKFKFEFIERLNGITITIPALVDRKGDMIKIIKNMYHYYCLLYDKPYSPLLYEDIVPFFEYDFRRNIRQLKNIIERGVVKDCNPLNGILKDPRTLSELKQVEKKNIIAVEELVLSKINNEDKLEDIINKIIQYCLNSKFEEFKNNSQTAIYFEWDDSTLKNWREGKIIWSPSKKKIKKSEAIL